jgi:hypothetical protein
LGVWSCCLGLYKGVIGKLILGKKIIAKNFQLKA